MTCIHEIGHSKGFRVQSGEIHNDRKVSLSWSKAGFSLHSFMPKGSISGWHQPYLKKITSDWCFVPQLSFQAFEVADLLASIKLPAYPSLFSPRGNNTLKVFPQFVSNKANSPNNIQSHGRAEMKTKNKST